MLTYMKKLFISLFLVVSTGLLLAQEPPVHHRSAEEKALKQTEMIARELHINDTTQYHQLFDMHLRYARQYENGCTRAQFLEQVEAMNKELQEILTPTQYEAFMNKQVQEGPHGPRPQVGRIGHYSGHKTPPHAMPNKEQEQQEPQLQDPQ